MTVPRLPRLAVGLSLLGGIALTAPAVALGHTLNATYTSRLPLAVYLAGAATTVALSFIFVLVRDVRAERPDGTGEGRMPPAALGYLLRALGLVAWLWIVIQGIVGGESDAEVATLFIWIYGWVGVAMISAIVGPVWHFLDPFSTLYDIGAAIARRLDIEPWDMAEYPAWLGRWPAVIGFAVVVWLELVLAGGPQVLFVVLVGYTAFTLAMMAQFGRDTWRSNAEVFTVWFRLLGRLAPFALADEDGRIRRRPFLSGLLEPGWTLADVVIIALGVGSILFDGLSQTQLWFDLFGLPSLLVKTLVLVGFLGIIVLLALGVTRFVGVAATGAGLLPIAMGYLVAHYLTYLLIDGQTHHHRDLGPTPERRGPVRDRVLPDVGSVAAAGTRLDGPAGRAWSAVTCSGRGVATWSRPWRRHVSCPPATLRTRQVPLAVVMVALTTLTLWSLGQAIVVSPPDAAAAVQTVAATSRG